MSTKTCVTGTNFILHKARFPPLTTYVLEQVQRDGALWGDLDGLAPELELGVDAAVEPEDIGLGVEGADGRVVAHLLTHDLEAQILPTPSTHTHQVISPIIFIIYKPQYPNMLKALYNKK